MAEVSTAIELEAPSEPAQAAPAARAQPVGVDALSEMTAVAQSILTLARKRALAPNLEKSPRRYSLTEVAELVSLPRKTLEYAIATKDLPKGEADGRKRL